jgi:hypothetical protein
MKPIYGWLLVGAMGVVISAALLRVARGHRTWCDNVQAANGCPGPARLEALDHGALECHCPAWEVPVTGIVKQAP